MPSRPDLRLDWCSYAAAKYAVEHWHYSQRMPAGKLVRIGAWEDARFVGCVVVARGSNKYLGLPFGLAQTECVELVRVALTQHETPTSRIVALACRLLKRQSPGLRLVLSFADMAQGHIGTLYQAAGWLYAGLGTDDPRSRPYRARNGVVQHWRTVNGGLRRRGLPATLAAAASAGYLPLEKYPKHRYLMPLDAAMRATIAPLAQPYPKRACATSSAGAAPGDQPGEGGSSPTVALPELG